MKNKRIILSLILVFTIFSTYGQIKVVTNGDVGIGTSSPLKQLHVVGNSLFTGSTSSTTSSAYIRGHNSYSYPSAPDYSWYGNTTTGIYHPTLNAIAISTNATERFYINSSGNITLRSAQSSSYSWTFRSIATRADSKMYIIEYGTNNHTYYVRSNGDVFANAVYTGSDISFKENIQDIENPLDKVLSLRGVTFQMKPLVLTEEADSVVILNDEPEPTQMGVIAQEVEAVVPEVITTTPEGKKYVAYQNLIGLLIEAIKEQQVQIEELQAIVDNCCAFDSELKMTSNTSSENNNIESSKGKSTLFQNYPNPFNENTKIKYTLAKNVTTASLLIFDLQGSLIKSYKDLTIGNGELTISSMELQPGMYYYSLIANGNEVDTKKMILTD